MSVEDFMNSPLVRWVQLFKLEPLTYSDVCDGAVLLDIIQQIDPKINACEIHSPVTDLKNRLQNWDNLINAIQSYYQNVLQQLIVMKLPDVVTICRSPYSDEAQSEMQRALLLILGCAIQCEQRLSIVEKIKTLDLADQENIMLSIKEVNGCPQNVLPMESFDDDLDNKSADSAQPHILKLLRERQENRSQIQDVILTLEELRLENKRLEDALIAVESANSHSKTKSSPSVAGQLRRLQLELDEKTVENQELLEELEKVNRSMVKLRNENLDLINRASAARAYRDELDILQEKANMASKYESENVKLREKLNDLDFFRARIKELSSENSQLLESKLEIEEELSVAHNRIKSVVDLEEQLNQYKRHLDEISAERDSDRQKMNELSEENARLLLDKTNSQHQNISLEEELRFVRMNSESGSSVSLAEQISEKMTSKLLRLESENHELRKLMDQNQNNIVPSNRKQDSIELLQKSFDIDDGMGQLIEQFALENQMADAGVKSVLDGSLESGSFKTADFSDDGQLIQQFKDLKSENENLVNENIRLKEDFERLQLIGEKHAEVETTVEKLRVENEKLTKKLASAEILTARVSAAEHENTQLKIEAECLQRTVESLKSSSAKIVDLEHEKEILSCQIGQLQNSLESAKVDRVELTSLKHDLESAVGEKIQLKRHLDSTMSDLKSSQEARFELESENERMQKSLEELESASKKFDHIQEENDVLEAENQSLVVMKSAAERENARLRQVSEDRKKMVEDLSVRVAKLEATKKELTRKLDRNQFSLDEREAMELQSLPEIKEADSSLKTDMDIEKYEGKVLFTHVTKSTPGMSVVPVQVVVPNRAGAVNNSSISDSGSFVTNSSMIDDHDVDSGNERLGNRIDQLNDLDSTEFILADVGLRSSVIKLERKNAVIEEENRNLKLLKIELQNKLDDAEQKNSTIHKELSSTQGHCQALQSQLDRLQADSLILAPQNALLESRNVSLQHECDTLRSRLSQILDDERELSLINIRLQEELTTTEKQVKQMTVKQAKRQNEHEKLQLDCAELKREITELSNDYAELEHKHDELQSDYDRLKTEYASIRNEHSSLTLSVKTSTEETSELRERCSTLAKERDELQQQNATLGEQLLSNDNSAELAKVSGKVNRLKKEIADERKRNEKLQAENMRAKEDFVIKLAQVEMRLVDTSRQLNESEKDNNGLTSKCEVLSHVQTRLEDENQALMVQLQAQMARNQELLGEIINSKDQYAEKQKSYLVLLSELQLEKKNLEERINEHNREKELAKKRGRGFGAFVKRTFMKDKDKKSRERYKPPSESDPPLTPSSSNSCEATPMPTWRADGDGDKNSQTLPSQQLQLQQQQQNLRSVISAPKLNLDVSVSDDEQITLQQFLQECNQSPKGRKRLLQEKHIELESDSHSPVRGKYCARQSSFMTMFYPLSARSESSVARSRMFKSELNLHHSSQTPQTSGGRSSNITDDLSSTTDSPRSEFFELDELSLPLAQPSLTLSSNKLTESSVDTICSGDRQDKIRKPLTDPAELEPTAENRVSVPETDVAVSSAVAGLQRGPEMHRHSRSLSRSGTSSTVQSQRSSKKSGRLSQKNDVNANVLSADRRTKSKTTCVTTNVNGTETAKSMPRSAKSRRDGCNGGTDKSQTINSSPADKLQTINSYSDTDNSQENHLSPSLSSSSSRLKPIPYIDEPEQEEGVEWRESNVCI